MTLAFSFRHGCATKATNHAAALRRRLNELTSSGSFLPLMQTVKHTFSPPPHTLALTNDTNNIKRFTSLQWLFICRRGSTLQSPHPRPHHSPLTPLQTVAPTPLLPSCLCTRLLYHTALCGMEMHRGGGLEGEATHLRYLAFKDSWSPATGEKGSTCEKRRLEKRDNEGRELRGLQGRLWLEVREAACMKTRQVLHLEDKGGTFCLCPAAFFFVVKSNYFQLWLKGKNRNAIY